MPNIIANKFIIPELIVKDAKPELIAKKVEDVIYNSTKRLIMVSELSNVAKLLSDKNSALEAAKVIDTELFP